MTLDQLRRKMVEAIKAGDKDAQAVIFSLIQAIRTTGAAPDAAIRRLHSEAQEQLLLCPAGREDLKQELITRREILDTLLREAAEERKEEI